MYPPNFWWRIYSSLELRVKLSWTKSYFGVSRKVSEKWEKVELLGWPPAQDLLEGKSSSYDPGTLGGPPLFFHCASYCLWPFSLSLTIRKVSLCSSSLTFPKKSLGETFFSPYPAQDLFEALTSRYDLWTLEVPHYYFIAHLFLVDTRRVSLLDQKLFFSFFTNFCADPQPKICWRHSRRDTTFGP